MSRVSSDDLLNALRAAFRPHGIFLRGTIDFDEPSKAPLLANGDSARSVVLLGNIGSSIWPAFSRWRNELQNREIGDPLDHWSKSIIVPVARVVGATAYFPSDPPWQPFQQWAMQAEGLQPSPLGILIHPKYGLWHGYRGALGFGRVFAREPEPAAPHPCNLCTDKPCLTHCPADAVNAAGFSVDACRAHLRTPTGAEGCMASGCEARNACPVGQDYRYVSEQLRFHMAALHL